MKRHNLLAVLILTVAVGGCAMLVEYGDADVELTVYQPVIDFEFDGGDAP